MSSNITESRKKFKFGQNLQLLTKCGIQQRLEAMAWTLFGGRLTIGKVEQQEGGAQVNLPPAVIAAIGANRGSDQAWESIGIGMNLSAIATAALARGLLSARMTRIEDLFLDRRRFAKFCQTVGRSPGSIIGEYQITAQLAYPEATSAAALAQQQGREELPEEPEVVDGRTVLLGR
jgi:hypothetical protein